MGRLIAELGQSHRDGVKHHRNGDQEDDQQYQHHVHQGRGVDHRQHLVVTRLGADGNRHGSGHFAQARRWCVVRWPAAE